MTHSAILQSSDARLTSDQIRADTAVTLFTSLVTRHMSQLLGPDVRSRQKCVQRAAGCQIPAEGRADVNGQIKHFAVSPQMELFAVERRKAWRMVQSKAGYRTRTKDLPATPYSYVVQFIFRKGTFRFQDK